MYLSIGLRSHTQSHITTNENKAKHNSHRALHTRYNKTHHHQLTIRSTSTSKHNEHTNKRKACINQFTKNTKGGARKVTFGGSFWFVIVGDALTTKIRTEQKTKKCNTRAPGREYKKNETNKKQKTSGQKSIL